MHFPSAFHYYCILFIVSEFKHHWIQTDMLSSAGGHSHSRPSHDSPNSHHSHCDWPPLWSHLQL